MTPQANSLEKRQTSLMQALRQVRKVVKVVIRINGTQSSDVHEPTMRLLARATEMEATVISCTTATMDAPCRLRMQCMRGADREVQWGAWRG